MTPCQEGTQARAAGKTIYENPYAAFTKRHSEWEAGWFDHEAPHADRPPQTLTSEMRRLVIAARIVAFGNQEPETLRELDAASEAFAADVPWDDDPTSPVRQGEPR